MVPSLTLSPSLDSIGLAGFSHDFESLAGKRNDIVDSFDQMAEKGVDPLDVFLVLLSPAFPILHRIPTKRHRIVNRMNSACGVLARRLLQDNRTEKDADRGDRSIMGLLIRAEKSSGVSMSEEEVIAQMKTLMVAGYETTAASMTWMFIELCRHPELQTQLREELLETYPSSDPTYEDLVSQTVLPWLDAVVHESLRLHPALHETPRTAIKDDVLPLSMPITLPDGTTTDRVFIAKGQTVVVPLLAINQSVTFWGEDAKKFRPSRWIEGMSDGKAQELLAYRHIMTFIDGPKTCLGKSFAVLEMKAVLSVLIRKYVFDLPNGPETKIGKQAAIILRPKVEGEKGTRVPMKIRRVEE
jgi:cytochrome P450